MDYDKALETFRSEYSEERFGKLLTDKEIGHDWYMLKYENGMHIQISRQKYAPMFVLVVYCLNNQKCETIDQVFEWYRNERIHDLTIR